MEEGEDTTEQGTQPSLQRLPAGQGWEAAGQGAAQRWAALCLLRFLRGIQELLHVARGAKQDMAGSLHGEERPAQGFPGQGRSR